MCSACDGHEGIYTALASRDGAGAGAREAMTAHIEQAANLLMAYLDHHRSWPEQV